MEVLFLFASLIKLIDRSRPTVIGMTTPGKRTVLRRDSKGMLSGTSCLCIAFSSSSVMRGINSLSCDSANNWKGESKSIM